MDQVKDAFQKVKQDMDSLREQVFSLKQIFEDTQKELINIKETMNILSSQLNNFNIKETKFTPTDKPLNPAHNLETPTDNLLFNPPNTQKAYFSTGNDGVPADRQTDQQTENTSLKDAFEVLNSLDSIKKEIRNKFKRITDQEFLVFSTIYQLAEGNGFVDYKDLSIKLNLTESSIRDYVGRLIKKGIPVEKTKINNKIIQLSISENLKKIAPLPVIFQLREL
jgi:DNA-binding MarR family transcriptional regulator